MRGNQNSLALRQNRSAFADIFIKLVKLLLISLVPLRKRRFFFGNELTKIVIDGLHRIRPELYVEPNVRIKLALLKRQAVFHRNRLRNGCDKATGGKFCKNVAHFRLKMQTVVQNQVSFVELFNVACRRLVEMRVNARAHQRRNLHVVSAYVFNGVFNHTDCRNDKRLRVFHIRFCAA